MGTPSVVMLHNYTADNLFFHPLLLSTTNKLTCTIRDGAVLAPVLHGWRLFVAAESLYPNALENRTFLVRDKLDIVVCHGEIKHPETREVGLVGRRLDDLVYALNKYASRREVIHGLTRCRVAG
jgi:hypothetical protein